MTKNNISFALATYGEKHFPLIYSSVYSIIKHMPESYIYIFWSDTPDFEIEILGNLSNKIIFIKQSEINPIIDGAGGDQIVSQKMRYWLAAMSVVNSDYIVFIDTDTIVMNSMFHITDNDFDIAITYTNYRNSGPIINTGVVIVKRSEKIIRLIQSWAEETLRILSDEELSMEAIKTQGGADQYALINVINYKSQKSCYEAGGVIVFPVSCDVLNEIRCRPLTENIVVYHLKGGWHPIILDGKSFSAKRPCMDCSHILKLWLEMYRKGSEVAFHRFFSTRFAAQIEARDSLVLISKMAQHLSADRIVIIIDRTFSEAEIRGKIICDIPIYFVFSDEKINIKSLLLGSPAIFMFGDASENLSEVINIIKQNKNIRVIGATLSKDEYDRRLDFATYRSVTIEHIADADVPFTISVPTYLDYAHRRRNPDWAPLLKGQPIRPQQA